MAQLRSILLQPPLRAGVNEPRNPSTREHAPRVLRKPRRRGAAQQLQQQQAEGEDVRCMPACCCMRCRRCLFRRDVWQDLARL